VSKVVDDEFCGVPVSRGQSAARSAPKGDAMEIARRFMAMSDIDMANAIANEVTGRYAQGSKFYSEMRCLAKAVLDERFNP
jgi:hypothetical protein